MNFNQENIMKTQHLYFAAFAILFASCAKQEAEMSPVQSDNEQRTFVADCEQTKTNLAQDEEGVYKKMIWSAGDKVGIFDASGVPQPFETKTGGASATFTGSATAPSGSWYAFYPYSAKAKMGEKDGKHYLLSAIPEIQYAKKDGVSDNVTLLVAKCAADETTLSFKHACGLVKIELPVECISVTLEVLNPNDLWAQPLSGGVKVDFGKPTDSWSELLCYTSVTLVGENGGNIPAGTYYLAVKPIDFDNRDVLLSIRNAENKIYVKKRTGFTVGAGQIRPITINPGWVEDDGLNLFSEMGGTSIYKSVAGEFGPSSDPLSTTDENQPKIYGTQGTKIEYSSDKAWSGRVGLQNGSADLTNFIDKGYSVEYFVKFDESMLNNDRQLVFRHWFKTNSSSWTTLYDECNIIRYTSSYPSTLGIQDTEWHRISFPLTSTFMNGGKTVWQFIIDPNFTDDVQAAAAKGSIFYFDELRLVRKTPTK